MTSIRNAYTVENHFNDYPCSTENEQVPLTGLISNSNTNRSLDLFFILTWNTAAFSGN